MKTPKFSLIFSVFTQGSSAKWSQSWSLHYLLKKFNWKIFLISTSCNSGEDSFLKRGIAKLFSQLHDHNTKQPKLRLWSTISVPVKSLARMPGSHWLQGGYNFIPGRWVWSLHNVEPVTSVFIFSASYCWWVC